MKRIALVITICFALLLCSCNNEISYTKKTEYDDVIHIYAYLSGNLHGQYLHCTVTAEGVNGKVNFFDKNITYLPSKIDSEIQSIAMYEDVRVYKLYSEFIVIYRDQVESFPLDYNLNDFINQISYNGVKPDAIFYGISALCRTQNFKYISRYYPILEYISKDNVINSLIQRWAQGDFTEEELEINQDYTREEISLWCKNYS